GIGDSHGIAAPYLALSADILERGLGEVAPLRPVPDRGQVDSDNRGDKRPLIAKGDGLGDERAEFELVLDELRRERGAVSELANVLGAIDNDKMAATVDKPGIPGAEP